MKSSNNIPWPVWAIVTIIVSIISAYAIIHTKGGDNPPLVTAPTTNSTDLNQQNIYRESINYEKEKGLIKTKIMLASSLEAAALRDLNSSSLSEAYRDDALNYIKSEILQSKKDGTYMLNALLRQSFGEFNIYQNNDELYAEVDLREEWASHIHRINDDMCIRHIAPREIAQKCFLNKIGTEWYITSISFDDYSMPDSRLCGKYNCPGVIK